MGETNQMFGRKSSFKVTEVQTQKRKESIGKRGSDIEAKQGCESGKSENPWGSGREINKNTV